jgi:dethiobiotin synthetase
MNYFVTGIDTDSGKTLASAILCEALKADYWKPVQAGLPRDSATVRDLISNTKTKIHCERYLLNTPASPHASAAIDGIEINLNDIRLPASENNHMIIEGAGGCLVPLNDRDFVIDLASQLKAEVILVADLYLGSINHTLLTIEAITKRNLLLKGIIFNGDSNTESERIILLHSKLKPLVHIKKENTVDKDVVIKYANLISKNLL